MSKNRDLAQKKVLRVQVEFWKPGEDERAYTGYTTDISASGVFVACHSPFPRGSSIHMRIRAENAEEPVVIVGTVARAVKVPVQFRRIRTSGMGITFDDPSDAAVLQLEALGKSLSTNLEY